MTRNQQTSPHNREVEAELDRLERHPFREPVKADHTDRYPQPEEVNGHIPDIVTEHSLFGTQTLIEVEHRGDNSQHTQSQQDAFEEASVYDPATEFETEFVDDEDDDNGLFGLF